MIENSQKTGSALAFYCYEPSAMFAEYDLYKITEPPLNSPDYEDRANSEVNIAYSSSLKESNPELARYLDSFSLTLDRVNEETYKRKQANQS